MPILNTVIGGGGGSGDKALFFSVELLYSDWKDDDEDITVSYQEVSDENFFIEGYSYLVSPYQDDYNDYIDASIRAFDVNTEGKMMFVCLRNARPTKNLQVDILRIEEKYDE